MSMYGTISAHKARVLAMTCMENQGSVQQSMTEDERKKLNTFIRDYTAKFGGPAGMRLLDLGAGFGGPAGMRLLDLGAGDTH